MAVLEKTLSHTGNLLRFVKIFFLRFCNYLRLLQIAFRFPAGIESAPAPGGFFPGSFASVAHSFASAAR
jgi:hypothetical protein